MPVNPACYSCMYSVSLSVIILVVCLHTSSYSAPMSIELQHVDHVHTAMSHCLPLVHMSTFQGQMLPACNFGEVCNALPGVLHSAVHTIGASRQPACSICTI